MVELDRTAGKEDGAVFAEIGSRLRAARAKVGMTRKQLVAASGISERYLAHIESGSGNPSMSMLVALSAALDVTIPELLPLGGERTAQQAQLVALIRRLSPDRLDALAAWLERTSPAHGTRGRRIVLVGLRGAGKSSLGQALADRLLMPFCDMSKEVERVYGGGLGLLIEMGGQSALRRYENEAWLALEHQHAAVIGVPGGIVADGPLYDRILGASHSIWLRATPEDHMSRVMAQGDFRPMESNRSAMTDLKAILDARSGDYSRANATLNTSAQDFETTLDRLEQIALELLEPAM
jgi:XRE family aerobic/anaerobic benzoate catabolism transcriptional regulator